MPAALAMLIYSGVVLPLGSALPAYQQVPLSLAMELLQYATLRLMAFRHGHSIHMELRLVMRLAVAAAVSLASDFSR